MSHVQPRRISQFDSPVSGEVIEWIVPCGKLFAKSSHLTAVGET